MYLQGTGCEMGTHFNWLRQGAVTGSFEDGMEISICISSPAE
jgi:hypothetical protein